MIVTYNMLRVLLMADSGSPQKRAVKRVCIKEVIYSMLEAV